MKKIIPEKRFKIGDKITFKSKNELPEKKYIFGGIELGGVTAIIKEYRGFCKVHNSYHIVVDFKNKYKRDCTYGMYEFEFKEYDLLLVEDYPIF